MLKLHLELIIIKESKCTYQLISGFDVSNNEFTKINLINSINWIQLINRID